MDYNSYSRTLAAANAREQQKRPGQDFCSKYGWKLTQDKYLELQRPDNPIMVNGTIYRTHTPTTHIWYKNKENGQHVWIEFTGNTIIVKTGIKVSFSEGTSFGSRMMTPHPSDFTQYRQFFSGESACNYLLSC